MLNKNKTEVFDDCCKDNEENWIRCPYCGECYYQEGYTTSTLIYCPTIIKDGKVVSNDLNTCTTHCTCLACGKEFTIDNKGNVSKCEQPAKPANVEFNNEGCLTITADNDIETVKQTLDHKTFIVKTSIDDSIETINDASIEDCCSVEGLKKYIENSLKDLDLSNSKLYVYNFRKECENLGDPDSDDICYYILTLSGGLNGRGNFLFYLEDVEKVIKKLMNRFDRVWLINWDNDCPDDVFDINIGVSFN